MPKLSWKETDIYKQLKLRTDDYSGSTINLLERPEVMDKIESILDKGGTTPKDFTLHDADHSFRVANTMWQLIPVETQENLSDYELGLLLLSAFLHDIGMSPDFEKVENHRDYLMSDEKITLQESEINEFQKWIDNDNRTKNIDIRKEKITDQKLLNYILAYYVRYKHNDWSGNWIKANLEGIVLKNYRDWIDDLIKICKSHHYGLEYLSKDIFDPKPIISGVSVHVRYLSMCLRVADVMENDPERTPEVILRHRLINADSIKYWLKDKQYNLTRVENKFTLYARPDRAYIHKAIEETAQWIEDELRLCDELIKLKPLIHSHFGELDYYKWNIDALLFKDIAPKDDTYVYIQGGFKPNTAKLLELLGGNQLYGNSLWAYRELIQNSFDAVKERVAFQIINENKSPTEFLSKLGSIYSIDISLEKKEDGIWLICKDQGVGMTKNIIEKFFLESGSSKRHEISELERQCKTKGFVFDRTGQFGIGVLSYFMIAEKVIVKTKRELNTGYSDSESKAWYFEINGTHDFGELKKYNKPIIGTHIEFKLKSEVEENIDQWNKEFRDFIKEVISYSPCNLSYNSFLENTTLRLDQGWTNSTLDIKTKIINKINFDLFESQKEDRELISLKQKENRTTNEKLYHEIISEVSETLNFLFDEGSIPGLGKYRIHIPYFKLANGNSFVYIKESISSDNTFLYVNGGNFWQPKFDNMFFSLKGIKIEVYKKGVDLSLKPIILNANNVHIEIIIESIDETSLSVSRHNLILGKLGDDFEKFINEKIKKLTDANISSFDNIYGMINKQYFSFIPTQIFLPSRLMPNEFHGDILFHKINYPATFLDDSYFYEKIFNGADLNVYCPLEDYNRSIRLDFDKDLISNFILGITNIKKTSLFFSFGHDYFKIISEPITNFDKKKDSFNYIDLPHSWENILLICPSYSFNENDILLNYNSNIANFFDINPYLQLRDNILTVEAQELTDETLCMCYLLACIIKYQGEKWIALCEKKEKTFSHLFEMLKTEKIFFIKGGMFILVSYKKWEETSFINDEIRTYMPKVSDKKYLLKNKKTKTRE